MTLRTTTKAAAATVFASGLLAAGAPAASALDTSSLTPPTDCEVDVEQVAEETAHPIEGATWTVGEEGNLCGNLGYLFLETTDGTGSSPTQVVLYHQGERVETQPAGDSRVLLGGHSDFHVELKIQQPPADDDANAEAEYASTYYVWNPLSGDATAVPLPAGFPS